jgi:hypothetical protein
LLLEKLVPEAGGSSMTLAKCKRHCEKKKFVFFYDPSRHSEAEMCQKRLNKYFSRGWTCLNGLPPAFVQHHLAAYAHCIKPKQKYNRQW